MVCHRCAAVHGTAGYAAVLEEMLGLLEYLQRRKEREGGGGG